MNTRYPIGTSFLAVALGLCVQASPLEAAEPATACTPPAVETRVTTLRRPTAYTAEANRFRRNAEFDASGVALPARVLCTSPKGYVQVDSASGQVWLDSMDIVLDPPRQLKASCINGVSAHPNRRVAGVSGAGEDC